MGTAIGQRTAARGRSIAARLDDWLNLIVVKELRQAMRARYITGLLMLLLIGQLVVLAVYTWGRDVTYADELGPQVLNRLLMAIAVACRILLPIYCAVRYGIERSRTNVDLYFSAGMRPGSIMWGKLCSGLVIAVLMLSTSAPFLVITYLLRGIDIPSILKYIVFSFVTTALAIQVGLFIAGIRASVMARIALGLVALLTFTPAFTLLALAFGVRSYPSVVYLVLSSVLAVFRAYGSTLPSYAWSLAAIGMFFLWSVALFSPGSANRMLPVRVFITAAWILTGLLWGITLADPGVWEWAAKSTELFAIMMLVASSEREAPGRRVARRIPRRAFLRPLAFLFYSGAAGGIMWAASLSALTVLACSIFPDVWYGEPDFGHVLVAIACGAFACSLSAVLVRTYVVPKIQRRYTWMVALGLEGAVLLFILFANPRVSTGTYLTVHALWAAMAAVAAVPWFARQVKAFRPYEPRRRVRARALVVPEPMPGELP